MQNKRFEPQTSEIEFEPSESNRPFIKLTDEEINLLMIEANDPTLRE